MIDGKDAVWQEVKEQESNQLPKLTEEVFNRPDCPEWAKYAAVDNDGTAVFFKSLPKKSVFGDWWQRYGVVHEFGYHYDASDWKNSLIKRPEKNTLIKRPEKNTLPDWCKVGEWVWRDGKYHKIIETGQEWIITAWDEHTGFWGMNILYQFSQARLRPYNAAEMRGLIGKVLTSNSRSTPFSFLVVYAEGDGSFIESYRFKYTAEELKDHFTIDGKPCGVLEHLENGEWVE
jgi:hypothetical protein